MRTASGCLFAAIFAVGSLAISAASAEVGFREGVVSNRKLPAPVVSKSKVFLSVPHIKQGRDLCVPTSSAMVLAYYGEKHDPRVLKAYAENHKLPENRNSYTLWNDMKVALRKIGHNWPTKAYPKTEAGFRAGLRDIKRQLRKGRPVMIDVDFEGVEGHTFVVMGYDDEKQIVYIRDPMTSGTKSRILSYSKLREDWHNHRFAKIFGPWRVAFFTKPR
ncbi:C39 family peptidase [Marimonas arenosa]|uniref:C39 family peptidase n=1 Tax=Marimonas arenosa TaxID=1795305 RepID=A0AAE3WGN2_9RHOB|nr:C39 family peptidase [Marimonas arenosa]MDQ2091345.1 C39 family peptidase [Marimonas arenosa]